MKQEFSSKKLWVALTAFLIVLGVGVVLTGSGNGSQSLMSKFSGTSVTPANAASLWQPSAENPYRAKVTEAVSTRIDPIIIRMLSRGSSLTVDGYQVYLSNIVSGIGKIAGQTQYSSDMDVQNIVAYISYELSDAKELLASSSNIVNDITQFFEGEDVMNGTSGGSSEKAASEIISSKAFEEMMKAAIASESNTPIIACNAMPPVCTNGTILKQTNNGGTSCPTYSCEALSCPTYMPPDCKAGTVLKSGLTNGCTTWSCEAK